VVSRLGPGGPHTSTTDRYRRSSLETTSPARWQRTASAYGLDDFRLSMSVQYVSWAIAAFHLARVHPGVGDREGV
jgi:hypothetical protein